MIIINVLGERLGVGAGAPGRKAIVVSFLQAAAGGLLIHQLFAGHVGTSVLSEIATGCAGGSCGCASLSGSGSG
jgi:hypothetical protein